MTGQAPALTGISSMATRALLAELLDAYARAGGMAVRMQSVGGVDAARRVAAGESFDLVVLARPALERLGATGHVDLATCVDVARSSIAVAVRTGDPRPDLGDEAAVRHAVMQAARIGYSTGPSGDHLLGLLRRWGVDPHEDRRLVQAPPGIPVGSLLARGDVDMAFQQLGELRGVPGIAVAGVLPAAVQAVTVFSGAATAATAHAREVAALLAFLASPATAQTKRRHGLEP